MNKLPISVLFTPQPVRWGLRGDPYLWEEMKFRFRDIPMPASKDELKSLIRREFETLTGNPITTEERMIYIERFAHGGMSSGRISFEFWREVAIPLLVSRYK